MHVEKSWIPCKDKPWKQDLYVKCIAPLNPGDVKSVIVGFHGLGNFGEREYYYFAPWFSERGYAVIMPDLPYFGHNVKHRGVHGRIGKWSWQMNAMSEIIKWGLKWGEDYTGGRLKAGEAPWSMVGISMSGLGILDYGLHHFTNELDGKTVKSCAGITSVVPAVKFKIDISPLQMFAALLVGTLAPNFIYVLEPKPDPVTGLFCNSHDPESVAWCAPCMEKGKEFGLAGDDAGKEFQIDCFPASPLSTMKKVYMAMKHVNKDAHEWPDVPLFLTGASLDDMVDPEGAIKYPIRQGMMEKNRLSTHLIF